MRKKLSRFSRILANSRKFDAAKYSIFEHSRKFILAKNDKSFRLAKDNSLDFANLSPRESFFRITPFPLIKSTYLRKILDKIFKILKKSLKRES